MVGSRERALDVAEELAFQQGFRQGRAVDGHERIRGAATQVVDGPCQQLLAGAAFSQDQHRGIRFRRTGGPGKNLLQGFGSAEHAESRGTFFQPPPQCAVLTDEFARGQGSPHHDLKLIEVDGLGQEIGGAGLHGGYGHVDGSVRGHHHHGRVRHQFLASGEQFVAGHARHAQVREYQVHVPLPDQVDRGFSIGGLVDFVAPIAQNPGEGLALARLVIHDNDHAWYHRTLLSRGKRITKRAPSSRGTVSSRAMVPFMAATIWAVRLRPSPVPSRRVVK